MPICAHTGQPFEISDFDRSIYQRLQVPEPKLSPMARFQRRVSFRNDQNYYHNTCHLCQKKLISIYSPDKPVKVLCNDCFWNDKYDPTQYGQDFDFTRPFFEQYQEFRINIPRLAIFNTQSENSEFTVHSSRNRNCYMGSSFVDNEEVHYSDWVYKSSNSMDLLMCIHMQYCYQCIDSQNCYNSDYLQQCTNTNNSYLAFDCQGCDSIIACAGLRNKKYYILNQQKTKEEFDATIYHLKTNPEYRRQFQAAFDQLSLQVPKRSFWTTNSENSTGNYIVNSKNAFNSYNIKDMEDANYAQEAKDVKDGYDVTRIGGGELIYECCGIVDLKFSSFCNLTYQSDYLLYCDNCNNCHNCFGCFGLKNRQYCILNKQYTKEEYEQLLPKIIEHMKQTGEYGEFFPTSMSPFGYNETKAFEWFPISKEEALAKGWKWSDYEENSDYHLEQVDPSTLPTDINQIDSSITQKALVCTRSKKLFRIIQQELNFYKQKGLPIPVLSPKERHLDRVNKLNRRVLYSRNCTKCQASIQTTYTPDQPEIVYCEKCYLETVY